MNYIEKIMRTTINCLATLRNKDYMKDWKKNGGVYLSDLLQLNKLEPLSDTMFEGFMSC